MTTYKRKTRKKTSEKSAEELLLDQAIDGLLKSGNFSGVEGYAKASQLFAKRFIEAALQGEMTAHLSTEKAVEAENAPSDGNPNKRNGKSTKIIKTNEGPMEVNIPRDRNSTFEPILLPKHARTFGKIDDQIIAMYARGMSTRDIEAFITEHYGVEVSPDYVSAVTDRVLTDIEEWQSRPLESVYPVVFFDALRVKIRHSGLVKSMAVHLALGVQTDGTREVLGMWIAENEGAAFWASVFNSLKNRGVEDILIAVTDGLKGMTQAIEAVFPNALHQTCIVHLIRASTAFISTKDRPAVCNALKPIYRAIDAEHAEKELEAFEASPMSKKYPAIAQVWRRAWPQVVPFFQFAPEIRTLIYTTNSIEGLNRAIRKVIKTRTLFPNEDAAKKLIYLAIRNFVVSWKRPSPKWSAAMAQFALMFGERFTKAVI